MLTDELGSEIIVDEKDKFVMRTKMCDTMLQPNGIIHGGISAYLAESAANLCVMHHVEDPEHMFPVGLELTSSHLLPVMPGDTVETVATAHSRGRSHSRVGNQAVPHERRRAFQPLTAHHVRED